jgi:4-methyl-5(b-hydroxyethyl)-thiazole monophosphate biosynthesis
LAEFGVDVQRDERIVVDDNVVTSFCPETAPDVTFQLLRWMVGDEQTEVIKHAMGY